MTNRKLRTRFRLVHWITLNGHFALLFQNTCVFWNPPRNLNEDRPIWMKIGPCCQQRRCSPMSLVSGNISFIQVFAGVPWRGASNDSGMVENGNFQCFQSLSSEIRPELLYSIICSLLAFCWPQNTWPWMALNGHFTFETTGYIDHDHFAHFADE